MKLALQSCFFLVYCLVIVRRCFSISFGIGMTTPITRHMVALFIESFEKYTPEEGIVVHRNPNSSTNKTVLYSITTLIRFRALVLNVRITLIKWVPFSVTPYLKLEMSKRVLKRSIYLDSEAFRISFACFVDWPACWRSTSLNRAPSSSASRR